MAASNAMGLMYDDSCCLGVASVAVWLLQMTPAAGHSAGSAAAAATQQPAVSYLPSLVIIGRCCLRWAEQLQQHAQELLSLTSAASSQRANAWSLQQQLILSGALLGPHSAARVCIPGWQQGTSTRPDALSLAFTQESQPGSWLGSLMAAVSGWVGAVQCPVAVLQLTAAGCAPQQVKQQLEVLLSAQQRTHQQGLTETSIAGLADQLQRTGAMLSSIVVRSFCNNPACQNVNGRTDARLVAGCRCLCAGCRTARYCGRDCQLAAWKQYKPVCKAMAVAAASSAATTTAIT